MRLTVIKRRMDRYVRIIKGILRRHGLGHLLFRCHLEYHPGLEHGIPVSWTIELRNKQELFTFCNIHFERYVNRRGILIHKDSYYRCKYPKQEKLRR